MSGIEEFLRARLDEDERVALAVRDRTPWRHDPSKHWRKPGTSWFEEAVFTGPRGEEAVCIAGTGESDHPEAMARADHIARHDPARVLAEVAAKRAIAELHKRTDDDPGGPTYCVECERYDGTGRVCPTLLLLAQVYADHPDYREEWRP